MSIATQHTRDGVPLVRLSNAALTVDIAPGIGGRVVSLRDARTGFEFLWRNPTLRLQSLPVDSPYDPNFYGGIDELLPSDLPETIDGLTSPDHGELWTTALTAKDVAHDSVTLEGLLPRWGLRYQRRMQLVDGTARILLDYRIHNPTQSRRVFLWKLHAAMNIHPGDRIACPARRAQAVDPEWSRLSHTNPFAWPTLDGEAVDRVPHAPGKADFFYLYDLEEGRMSWHSADGRRSFTYRFDTKVFPYCWYFATYGKLDGLLTGILEPCTAMPLSVAEAHAKGQCSVLEAGQTLETRVGIEVHDES